MEPALSMAACGRQSSPVNGSIVATLGAGILVENLPCKSVLDQQLCEPAVERPRDFIK